VEDALGGLIEAHLGILSQWGVLLRVQKMGHLTNCDCQNDSTPLDFSLHSLFRIWRASNCAVYLPQRKGQKKGARAAVHQASTNLHIERSTNGATNTNKLDMTTFELAVGVVAKFSDRAYRTRTTRLSTIECFLFVNMDTLDLVLVEVIAGRGHCFGLTTVESRQFRVCFRVEQRLPLRVPCTEKPG
jgi:hypothetical protein